MHRTRLINVSIVRNYVLALIQFFFLLSSPVAQVRVGFLGGTTVSDLNSTTSDSIKSNFSQKADLVMGGLIDIGLTSSAQLVFEPMYIQRAIDNQIDFFGSQISSKLSFAYIDIPMLLKLSLNSDGINPYLIGGGTISYLLDAEEVFQCDLGKELYGETVDIKEDVSEVDLSWTAGGGLAVPVGPIGVFAEGRYSRGLINIFDSDETEVFHEGYQFLGGITFPIGEGDGLSESDQPIYYDTAEPGDPHKCVGHRLMIIIGNHHIEKGKPIDPTIHATAKWARELKDVNHKVLFFKHGGQTISLTKPQVPGIEKKTIQLTGSTKTRTRTREGWIPYTYEETKGKKTKTRKGVSKDYGQHELHDCCFLEEVIVLSHGSQAKSHICKRVLEMLPELTGGRRIRKLTLWLCSSSSFMHPNSLGSSFRAYYTDFCELMAPRPCPCNCKAELCRSVCEDPEGTHPDGYRCPGVDDPGTIYMASWHEQIEGGKMKPHASKLYINPDNAGSPLTSPNGNMRVVTVSPSGDGGWTASTSIEHGANVFGDINVGTQKEFESDHKNPSSAIGDVMKSAKTISGKKPKPPAYKGPVCRPGGEGCIPVPKAM